jgi:hypothetical protein
MRHEKARYYYNDSGKFADCYTVVYSKGFKNTPFITSYTYATMSANPQEPNGVFTHGFTKGIPIDGFAPHNLDRENLGKRVTWSQLPQAIRTALEQEANQ